MHGLYHGTAWTSAYAYNTYVMRALHVPHDDGGDDGDDDDFAYQHKK